MCVGFPRARPTGPSTVAADAPVVPPLVAGGCANADEGHVDSMLSWNETTSVAKEVPAFNESVGK